MSHRHTVIDLAEGLTVLVGPNNCGKSAVVAALRTLAYNESSTFVTRHGENACAVRVQTIDADGRQHEIEWSRTKNSPRYLLDGKLFDRLNRGVPEEITRALKISQVNCENESFDVHFGEQKEPVFLLKDSGRAAAEFFASASDAVHLSRMQRIHKKRETDLRSEKAVCQTQLDSLEEQLEWIKPVQTLDQQLLECEQVFEQLRDTEIRVREGSALVEGINQTLSQQTALDLTIDVFESLQEPPVIEDLAPLGNLMQSLRETISDQVRLEEESKLLAAIPETLELEKTDDLSRLIQDHTRLGKEFESIRLAATTFRQLTAPPEIADTQGLAELVQLIRSQQLAVDERQGELVKLEGLRRQNLATIDQWLKTNPVCPTCGISTDISSDCPDHSDGTHSDGAHSGRKHSVSDSVEGNSPIPSGAAPSKTVPAFLRGKKKGARSKSAKVKAARVKVTDAGADANAPSAIPNSAGSNQEGSDG